MKNKRLLLGAAILLSALVSCSKPDVPPITRGDPGTIVNPTRRGPRHRRHARLLRIFSSATLGLDD